MLTTASVADLGLTAADAVVIMTHSYEQDRTLLTGLLGGSEVPGYIGLLGASHRSSLLVSEAAAALGCSVAECCEKVWAPVGLDLGGDGAEAIALAVIAEVQAWREGKLGASRRLTAERVAEQIAKGGASRYLQTQCALGATHDCCGRAGGRRFDAAGRTETTGDAGQRDAAGARSADGARGGLRSGGGRAGGAAHEEILAHSRARAMRCW